MAGSDEILVVYAFLDTLAANAKSSAEALESGSTLMDLEFTGTPEITGAYRDFLGKWDKHRDQLREGVAAAAQAFEVTSQTFRDVEDQLIAALDEPGG